MKFENSVFDKVIHNIYQLSLPYYFLVVLLSFLQATQFLSNDICFDYTLKRFTYIYISLFLKFKHSENLLTERDTVFRNVREPEHNTVVGKCE